MGVRVLTFRLMLICHTIRTLLLIVILVALPHTVALIVDRPVYAVICRPASDNEIHLLSLHPLTIRRLIIPVVPVPLSVVPAHRVHLRLSLSFMVISNTLVAPP